MLPIDKIFEELLRFREAASSETEEFTLTHNMLCDAILQNLNILGDSFIKYQSISYVIQGPRDQGVDVLLKISQEDESEKYVGIQVKSYTEIDDKKNDVSKQLKAGYHDARNHYGERLSRYYIILCCDAKKHANRVSALTNEFSKESAVRVIGPRNALNFIEMPEQTITAVVDHFLRSEDLIRAKAREEVFGYEDESLYFIITCLSLAFENSNDQLTEEQFRGVSLNEAMSDLFYRDSFGKVLDQLSDSVLEIYAESSSTRVRIDLFPAVRALYFDVQVRYGWSGDDMISHLYEFLKLK